MAAPMEQKLRKNEYDTREAWLRAATNELREHFAKRGYPLPEKIRFNTGFTMQGSKGAMAGQCIWPEASADQHFEIIVSASRDDREEVLGILFHQLNHVVTGSEHKADYRDAALTLGLVVKKKADGGGGLSNAMPGPVLAERLKELAEQLGPYPHAKLDYNLVRGTKASTMSAPQKGRQRSARCEGHHHGEPCPFKVNVSRENAREIGPPHCPRHGAMKVVWHDGEQPDEEQPTGPFTIDGEAEDVSDAPLQITQEAAE